MGDIRVKVKGLYEVRSSEGDWYAATILRRRRNGRFEAELFGAGVAMHYPSVEPWEIRRLRRTGKKEAAAPRKTKRRRVLVRRSPAPRDDDYYDYSDSRSPTPYRPQRRRRRTG